jgi:hypothetical protein
MASRINRASPTATPLQSSFNSTDQRPRAALQEISKIYPRQIGIFLFALYISALLFGLAHCLFDRGIDFSIIFIAPVIIYIAL